MDYQRQLMAELMAQYDLDDTKNFWDDDVCKNYLVAYCPSQLFTNTKSDLGPCTKIHNDKLRDKYRNTPDKESRYPYEVAFVDYITSLVTDLDHKIRRNKERLDIQPDAKTLNPGRDEREESIVLLDERIKEMLAKIEGAGEEGRVQEAAELTEKVERLQHELTLMKNRREDNSITKLAMLLKTDLWMVSKVVQRFEHDTQLEPIQSSTNTAVVHRLRRMTA
ncbi:hypothetical protein BC936DRAFT_149637 [Jimgerdemannia flammicorona]|uniref:LUC7-domain-containing protein n=1 Tax=Jimgerdemannia flammicorona TaxID=994334 RepID=A0A433DJU1_9FUNG|nr:hypothetical protein BC936DRAFT_149637 [Jimgerdemannia flammicorona]